MPSSPNELTLRLRLERALCRLRLRARRARRQSTTVDMATFIDFYKGIWSDAARRLGADLTEVRRGTWRVQYGSRSTLIDNYVVQIDDPVVLRLAGDKALCHRLMIDAGLRVPEHEVFTLPAFDRAARFVTTRPGAYFVVKPAAGTSGARGITTHLQTVDECRRASVLASLYGVDLLIEQWAAGESYRLLFLDGEMIHASRRRGRRVVGDGVSTIGQLIAADTADDRNHRTLPRDLVATLLAQRLHVDDVLERGRGILVESSTSRPSSTAEIRTVFDEDATAIIGPELRSEAGRAVQALGSRFAGVDIITIDPSRSLVATGGVINEINTTPGLHHHYNLRGGPATDPPAVHVLERLLRTAAQYDRRPSAKAGLDARVH